MECNNEANSSKDGLLISSMVGTRMLHNRQKLELEDVLLITFPMTRQVDSIRKVFFNLVSSFITEKIALTLLMAQWVDMRALENKNHASLMLFDSLGAIRQISRVIITHQHVLSA